MHVLGIDPGGSTGFVIFDPHVGIIDHRTIVDINPMKYIREVLDSCDVIVMEESAVFGCYGQISYCGYLSYSIKSIKPETLLFDTIRPADWKPFAKARKWQQDKELATFTQHEKDAYCIARYYYAIKIDPIRKGADAWKTR